MVRIGTCSWADEGLVKNWYPRGVSSPAARLAYYAERFDVVEVDSPFYRLPSPETTAKWAERTPDGFTWHAKASAAMTGHEEADRETAFREFREAFEPLEASGKLRGVLLQYHPRVVKSREAKEEIAAAAPLLDPLQPLVEFRHRSWLEEDERADTLAFLEAHGLAYVSVDSPRTRASNVIPASPLQPHPSPTSASTAATGGRGTSAARNRLPTASTGCTRRRSSRSGSSRCGGSPSEAEEVYALMNNNKSDYAPKSATLLRELLDEHGIEATGAVEPPQVGQLDLGL